VDLRIGDLTGNEAPVKNTAWAQQDLRPAEGIAIAVAAGPILWAIAIVVLRLIALR
jgi:hypothetical protein